MSLIFDPSKLSMPQQVEKNKNDIESLFGGLFKLYYTSTNLATTDTSIALSITNIPTQVETDTLITNSYLLDYAGHFFKITGANDTTTTSTSLIYVEYVTNMPKVYINYMGVYSNTTTYAKGDLVLVRRGVRSAETGGYYISPYDEMVFVSTTENNVGHNPTSTGYWVCISGNQYTPALSSLGKVTYADISSQPASVTSQYIDDGVIYYAVGSQYEGLAITKTAGLYSDLEANSLFMFRFSSGVASYKGEYNTTAASGYYYYPNDIVIVTDTSANTITPYVCIKTNVAPNNPPPNTEYWTPLVQVSSGGSTSSGLNYTATWVSGNEYHLNDVVTYTNDFGVVNAYVLITESLSGSTTPPYEDSTNWSLLSGSGQGVVEINGSTVSVDSVGYTYCMTSTDITTLPKTLYSLEAAGFTARYIRFIMSGELSTDTADKFEISTTGSVTTGTQTGFTIVNNAGIYTVQGKAYVKFSDTSAFYQGIFQSMYGDNTMQARIDYSLAETGDSNYIQFNSKALFINSDGNLQYTSALSTDLTMFEGAVIYFVKRSPSEEY